MRLLALIVKRHRLRQIREHLFILRDQRDSAIDGIQHYEAKAQRLEEQIASMESAKTILGRLA